MIQANRTWGNKKNSFSEKSSFFRKKQKMFESLKKGQPPKPGDIEG
jgi:hypothetical protein